MARITVEDCIDKFPSRFELVLVASQRARKLHSGDEPTVTKNNDKNTVIALREIAESSMTVEQMKEKLIQEYQTVTINDEEDENLELETLNSEQDGVIIDKDVASSNDESNSKETLVPNNHDTEVEEELSSLITSEESEMEQQYEIIDAVEDNLNNSQNLDNESDLVEETPE